MLIKNENQAPKIGPENMTRRNLLIAGAALTALQNPWNRCWQQNLKKEETNSSHHGENKNAYQFGCFACCIIINGGNYGSSTIINWV
jgi:hypothetical protein